MKEIPLTKGKFALVDDEDYSWLSSKPWYARINKKTSYAQRHLPSHKGVIEMHRMIMNPPQNLEVDHIDGNGLNNQRSNLRIVTHRQNSRNLHIVKKNKLLGAYHVPQLSKERPWVSKIKFNHNETRNLGYFKTAEEAAATYWAFSNAVENSEKQYVRGCCYD